MRFGTKILLLTLSITLGLSGIVVLAVRRQIIARETSRALQDIQSAADDYFARLDAMQDLITSRVGREMDDPNNRASLDALSAQANAEARQTAQAQLGEYIFPVALQGDLKFGETIRPAFHVLFDASGRQVIATAIDDPPLKQALGSSQIPWRVREVLRPGVPLRQYLLIDNRLFLAFAVPIRQTGEEDPAFAYFGGFAINDEWAKQFLRTRAPLVLMSAWFIVNDAVVARASEPQAPAQVWKELLDRVGDDAAPEQRRTVEFQVQGKPFVAEHMVFDPAPGARGVLALASSLHEALAPLRELQRQIAMITGGMMLLAVAIARWMSRRLARPVEELVRGTLRIGQGDFSTAIPVKRRDELGLLAGSFNEMAAGLKQRDLIKDTLGQFVDPRIADALITHPESLRGQRLVQSVLFSDLEKFTDLSERLSPEALVALLNRYLGASADIVKSLNGYLDKFTGDGVVAFWGPPVETNHAIAACRAALAMVELSNQFTDPPLRVRVGITTGEVLVGIIGSETSKKNYTAMGDVVNLAARLEGVNKAYGTQILVDARTAGAVKGSIATRLIDIVRVVGRAEAVELYEVLPSPTDGGYGEALKLYRARRWAEASEMFKQIADAPSRAMAARCQRFMNQEPDESWDGVWTLDAK